MDILTPHIGLTNEQMQKAQVEAVINKQNEYKLVGRIIHTAGHTLYKFNTTTREVSKADLECTYITELNHVTNRLCAKKKYKVKVEKDCYYEEALNIKNFIKRLRRRGLIEKEELPIIKK